MNISKMYNVKFVKELFDRISCSYDKVNNIATLGISKIIRGRILFSNLKKSNKELEILDLMSGNGETWKCIKELFPNGNITALDYSERMKNRSMKFNNTYFNNEVSVLNEDILNNSLQNNSYDFVVCAFGLKHFNSKQTCLLASEVYRILKPNGQFIFIEISVPSPKILQILFTLHFKYILPLIAKIFSYNYRDYKLLWVYLQNFQNCQAAHSMFESKGLTNNYKKHFLGMTTSIYGIKS